MTLVTGNFLTVLGKLIANRECGKIWIGGIETWNIGRRGGRGIVEEAIADPDGTFDRMRIFSGGIA